MLSCYRVIPSGDLKQRRALTPSLIISHDKIVRCLHIKDSIFENQNYREYP
jgi:hypothetical protein